VPLLFFAGNLLGTLFTALCLVQVDPIYSVVALLGGACLYGVVYVGTRIEPRWVGMVLDYLGYAQAYEG
jgi:NADH:ubiquinone oxidoreductase subunit 6 (subunit J)